MVKDNNSYVPSGGEISHAIAASLKDYDGPVNSNIVQQRLAYENPNWKLPERRVNKFLKRYLNNNKTVSSSSTTTEAARYEHDDNSTDLTTNSPKKRRTSITKSIGKLFGRRSSQRKLHGAESQKTQTQLPESAPISSTSLLPPLSLVETEEFEPLATVEEPEQTTAAADKERSIYIPTAAYEDDNIPAGREKCECNACIMM